MQGTVVVLIALSGLGCQNRDCVVFQPAPCTSSQYVANVYPNCVGSAGCPASAATGYGYGDSGGYSGGSLHSTFISFLIGHDPDVPTVREIEASVYSGRHGY